MTPVAFAPVTIDFSGFVPGVSVGLLVLVSVAIATGGLMIFRRMTGL